MLILNQATSYARESFEQLAPNSISPISALPTLKQKMQKRDKKCEPYINELAIIKVPYYGFDEKDHQGIVIAHQDLAQDLLAIFTLLHQHKFPVENISPFTHGNNVTISYNCREVTDQKGRLSQHSFGRAIDLNPLINPYMKGDLIIPPKGKSHGDRALAHPGKINQDSLAYKLFSQRGWDWGGNWYDLQDYQHFEKRAHGEKRNPYGYQ